MSVITHSHTHTHTHTRARTHTHTHTNMHYVYYNPGIVRSILVAGHTNREPDTIDDDEYFGTDFTITGNSFTYNGTTAVRSVMSFYHSGYDPRGYNPNSSDNLWHYITLPVVKTNFFFV